MLHNTFESFKQDNSKFNPKTAVEKLVAEEGVHEGRAFAKAVNDARENGLEEFEFNGKTYPLKEKVKKEVNENKIDIALNKMDEWLPENPEAMERYYEIIDQESWKEMEEFFNEYGDEDVLQSIGLKSKDMKKLAQAAMMESKINEEYIESIDDMAIDEHLGEIEKLWKAWKKGPMTDRSDIKPAGDELTHYILLWMRKTFK